MVEHKDILDNDIRVDDIVVYPCAGKVGAELGIARVVALTNKMVRIERLVPTGSVKYVYPRAVTVIATDETATFLYIKYKK